MEKLQNHVNHSKLAFSCGAGAANINVFTGRVLFESPDISIGVNSYEMGVTHIFDSQPDYTTEGNMGNGWKLNVHQYIYSSYERDENNQYLYTYVDAYGYTHKFERYEQGSDYSKYFDRTGLGLTLWIKGSEYFIEDAQGGRMYFENIKGTLKLVRTVSGLTSEITQYINYNEEGYIESIYDGRKKDRKFEFTYDEVNGLLKSIRCVANTSLIEFTYNGQRNLVSVKKTINSTIKYTVTYGYDNKLLKYAVNVEDNTSLRFIYDEYGRAVSVSDGLMKTEFKFSDPLPALFASKDLYSGTSCCGQQERKFLGFSVSENDSDFKQGENKSGISFGSSQTTVKNGKGVQTTYFFNEKGFTTGILEKSTGGKYKTLFRQTGVLVSGIGTGESINGNKSTRCTVRYDFPNDKKVAATNFFEKDINKKNYDYVLSFWVNLNAAQSRQVKARLCLKYRYADVKQTSDGPRYTNYRTQEEFSGSTMIDCTAKGGWQYVTIPFSFVKGQTTGNLYKNFIEICHIELDGVEGCFDIADARITPGRVPVFTFTNGSNQDSVLTMEQVESIKYTLSGGGSGGGNISKDFFMADSDIMQTSMEMIKARGSRNSKTTPYTLVCNAGTKRIANVTGTQFSGNGKSVTLDYTNEYDNYYKATFYVPNCKTATEPSSGDNRTYTFTAFNVNGSITRQHTHVIKYPDSAAASKQRESDEYTWTNKFGAEVKKRDAYGVTTTNTYDTYGNLTKTVLSGDGTSEEIKTEYVYDTAKETLISIKDGVSGGNTSSTYQTDPLHGTLISGKQNGTGSLKENEQVYKYNNYRDKLQQVELKVNGVVYGKNTLKYDESGRLSEVSPSDSCKYGFKYDEFGKAVSFSLNGVELLTKEYNYAGNSVTANYHRDTNVIDSIKMKHDKYGRLKSISCNGSPLIETTYQDEAGEFEESPSCANIKTMKDGSTKADYSYNYDPYNGRLTEYNVSNNEMSLKVFSAGSDKIKYEFDKKYLDYEDQITYDEDCLISPRITKAYNNSDWGMDWNFEYDHLGRYVCRKENYNFWFDECPTMTINYKAGTCLKNSIAYKNESAYQETITQEYDERGNITEIKDYYYNVGFSGTNISTYKYDDVNRLIREENTGLSAFTRTYSYDSEGNLTEVKCGNETETYTYEQGRLVKIRSNIDGTKTIAYDLFGNPTNYKGKAMTWERGTFLKTYNGVTYTYDGQGKLYKKVANGRTWINYYDGNKLIAQKVGNKIIRYFYDIEGVVGFKIGTDEKYTYAKDAQGNVVGLICGAKIVAKYVYDAWGNCKVFSKDNKEIDEWDDPALLNPIRWKSQYYDVDSGLYWMGVRWYDAEIGRYVSSSSPEMLLENASVVFALNLYALCTSNPVAVMFAASTFLPELDFYYNGEYKTWWEKNGWWVMLIVGAVATIVACIAAPFTCGASSALIAIGTTLAKIALGTAIGAAVSLAIGGTIAGIQSALTGHGFWQAFGDSVCENFVDAVTTSFAFSAVTIAASNIMKCFQCFKEGTLVETEDGLKPIEEIEVGDKVLAYDEETGEQDYKKVVRLFRNSTEEWYHIHVNGEEIICTGGHPFYLANLDKFIPARELKLGDTLLLSDNTCAIIKEIQVEQLSKPETTYNFEVDDFHTYYVTESKILVHNDCVARARRKAVKEAWKQERELVAKTGQGTRNWSGKQRMELLKKGKVKGFEGHHINSVHGSEALAGNPNNIRFVTRTEHFALHSYNWQTTTTGKFIDRMAMLNGIG